MLLLELPEFGVDVEGTAKVSLPLFVAVLGQIPKTVEQLLALLKQVDELGDDFALVVLHAGHHDHLVHEDLSSSSGSGGHPSHQSRTAARWRPRISVFFAYSVLVPLSPPRHSINNATLLSLAIIGLRHQTPATPSSSHRTPPSATDRCRLACCWHTPSPYMGCQLASLLRGCSLDGISFYHPLCSFLFCCELTNLSPASDYEDGSRCEAIEIINFL